jgi:hypothetical protein
MTKELKQSRHKIVIAWILFQRTTEVKRISHIIKKGWENPNKKVGKESLLLGFYL